MSALLKSDNKKGYIICIFIIFFFKTEIPLYLEIELVIKSEDITL